MASGSWSRDLKGPGPEQHNDHANADHSEREINVTDPCSQFGQRALGFSQKPETKPNFRFL